MSDQPDELKADLMAILNGGPEAVTADDAMGRAGQSSRAAVGRGRGPLLAAVSFAVVIGLLVGYLVTGGQTSGNSKSKTRPAHPGVTAEPSFIKQVNSVPASVYAKVGLPHEISNYPQKVDNHSPLMSDGRPELLYIWASYCPFCAAENWALVMALSKFGTFSGLTTTHSSVSDFAPDTPTISFVGATYTSSLLTLNSYDLASNQPASPNSKCNVNGYACLQVAPSYAMGLLQTRGGGSFPFFDFGNKVAQAGAGFEDEPLVLKGMSDPQIATALSDASSDVAQAEVGSANYFIAAICAMTGDHPSAICSSPVIRQAQRKEGVSPPASSTSKVVGGAAEPIS